MAKKKATSVYFDRRHMVETARWLLKAREEAQAKTGGDLMVGLDLSLTSTGMAWCTLADFIAIDAGGWEDPSAIKTASVDLSKSMAAREKVRRLSVEMAKLTSQQAAFSIVYEAVTVMDNPASFKALAMCNAMLYGTQPLDTLIVPVYTSQVKKVATGQSSKKDEITGKQVAKSKQEVIEGLNHYYNGLCDKLKIQTDDEADALALLIINGYLSKHLLEMSTWLDQPFSDDIAFQWQKRNAARPLPRERAVHSVIDSILISPTTRHENETVEHNKVIKAIKAELAAAEGEHGRPRGRKAATAKVLSPQESVDKDLDMLSKM
jgi:Holliday junction resolvasome RuvABC endonuclease subunit